MSDLDPTEERLRRELQAIDEPRVDVERVLGAGHRRARRRTVRNRAVAGVGAAGLVAVVAIAVLPDDTPDTVTDSPTDPATSTTAAVPPEVPLGEGTTWPGGPFDPIDGMVAVPGAMPLSGDERMPIYDAENRLVAACMAEQGYQWGSAVLGGSAGSPPLYLSPDELRSGGFDYEYDWEAAGDEFLDNSGGAAPETEGMTDEELDAYSAALFGAEDLDVSIDTHEGSTSTSSGGCMGEARAQVYGSVANALRYDALYEPDGFGAVGGQLREHEEYAQPLADWQACMGDAGFDVGDHDYGASYIQQAGAAALSNVGRDQTQFTAETIPAIAEADADCQETSGLYEVRESLLAGVAEEIAADLGVDLDHYVAYEQALLARAQQVP